MSDSKRKSNHTPGPWHIDECNTPNGITYEVNAVTPHLNDDGEPVMVNIADLRDFTDGQDLANARLIAAAPDLLALLKDANLGEHGGDEQGPCMCSQCIWRRRASAAIARAEGRGESPAAPAPAARETLKGDCYYDESGVSWRVGTEDIDEEGKQDENEYDAEDPNDLMAACNEQGLWEVEFYLNDREIAIITKLIGHA